MSITYFVALPFLRIDDAIVAGQPQELPNEHAAIRLEESMSRKAEHVGAIAFKRTGDPSLGTFSDATVLKSFGMLPDNLDEL
jgi:hypothetical protein